MPFCYSNERKVKSPTEKEKRRNTVVCCFVLAVTVPAVTVLAVTVPAVTIQNV
jgi:hypothetical protein